MRQIIRCLICAVQLVVYYSSSRTTKPAPSVYENNGQFYWKIGKTQDFRINKLNRIIFQGFPLCITREKDSNDIIATSDICVHRAASLSRGKVLPNGCVQCPYHGWEFKRGMIQTIPGCPENKMNFGVPRFPVQEINDDVFICPTYDMNSNSGKPALNDIYVPQEAYDSTFRKVSGRRHIKRPHSLITENVLDMMHVSFVHSFGNRLSPVPFEIQYIDIDEMAGKTVFYYTAGASSMSALFGNAKFVKVENEYYLPDTTVTRVFANDIVKTIVTHAYPVGKNESIFHYDLYRNFLENPVFDSLFRYQMDMTLDEDVSVLNSVYDAHQKGFMNTKFDVTQLKYRNKWRKLIRTNSSTTVNRNSTNNHSP